MRILLHRALPILAARTSDSEVEDMGITREISMIRNALYDSNVLKFPWLETFMDLGTHDNRLRGTFQWSSMSDSMEL